MKISIHEAEYLSENDERRFYDGLKALSGFVKAYGSLEVLHIELADCLSDEDLRELLALFARYGIEMSQLKSFLTEQNCRWFCNIPTAYWHEKVFGATEPGIGDPV